jgi:hypothetical protein
MTLREAIQFQFNRVTVTTEQSGDDKVYHYFSKEINGVTFIISQGLNGEWCGSILQFNLVFYEAELFMYLIIAIKKGTTYV